MTLDEAKKAFLADPSKRICRACNYRPYNYMPVYFTFQGDVLMVHDQDNRQEPKEGKPAPIMTDTHNDWMLY